MTIKFSNWIGAEVQFIEASDIYNVGDIVTCSTTCGDMVTIKRDDGGKNYFRKDRFELVEKKRKRKINLIGTENRFDERKKYNDQTKLEAINDAKEWPDDHLLKIYSKKIDVPIEGFPHPQIAKMARVFGRTYFAVEEQVRVCYSYNRTGEFRDFYWRSGELKRIAAQTKRLLDSLKTKHLNSLNN